MTEPAEQPSKPVNLGLGYTWEELHCGDRFRTLRRTVTETDLVSFISATGMLEAIFIDAGFDGAIAGRAVPGALTVSLIEGMQFQTLIQRTGLAMLEMSMTAHAPVVVGDTISGLIEIVEVKPTSKRNRGIVTSCVEISNQRGEKVMTYKVKRLVAGKAELELQAA
ncbi:MaoC family dehydratase N-terminal domain-containing protein [Sinorhizobium fredii]|uniref:MaoC family dehydratase n=1 Tax=Rhizobium fredii TaxID=380 RepID=UPI003096A815